MTSVYVIWLSSSASVGGFRPPGIPRYWENSPSAVMGLICAILARATMIFSLIRPRSLCLFSVALFSPSSLLRSEVPSGRRWDRSQSLNSCALTAITLLPGLFCFGCCDSLYLEAWDKSIISYLDDILSFDSRSALTSLSRASPDGEVCGFWSLFSS